jgi:hypothetical protein
LYKDGRETAKNKRDQGYQLCRPEEAGGRCDELDDERVENAAECPTSGSNASCVSSATTEVVPDDGNGRGEEERRANSTKQGKTYYELPEF